MSLRQRDVRRKNYLTNYLLNETQSRICIIISCVTVYEIFPECKGFFKQQGIRKLLSV